MKDNSMEFFLQGETLEEIIFIQEQKVKFQVWIQMEFYSWTMRIDEPSEVINLILDSVNEYYLDFPTIDEYFEQRQINIIKNETEQTIEDFDQRLKFAIQEHMGFLKDFLEFNDFETVMIMMDVLLYRTILEYVPLREQS